MHAQTLHTRCSLQMLIRTAVAGLQVKWFGKRKVLPFSVWGKSATRPLFQFFWNGDWQQGYMGMRQLRTQIMERNNSHCEQCQFENGIMFDCYYRSYNDKPSDPQEKLPLSNRRARYFLFPPRVRITWIRF